MITAKKAAAIIGCQPSAIRSHVMRGDLEGHQATQEELIELIMSGEYWPGNTPLIIDPQSLEDLMSKRRVRRWGTRPVDLPREKRSRRKEQNQ